ncbi:testis-expressed protein 45 [Ornithorhynchus anatinus]|uniref:Testis expressed 45 n=1 Tax=Ornithorhynchus anatinus TaxID=9258 RepID=F7FUX5_ORNAN|nr:testis-expressed protein 45 [Ornithorhynchus anatinus]
MAVETRRLIPPRLPYIDFLKASHIRLGAESQTLKGKTTFQEHYPPRCGNHKAIPIRPVCKHIFHQDPKIVTEMITETFRSYPRWPPQKRRKGKAMNQQETNFQMHVDSKITHFTTSTTMQNSYRVPRRQYSGVKKDIDLFGKDGIPNGDRDKIEMPLTQHRLFYQPHVLDPVARAPSKHLGGVSPIQENYCQSSETIYQKDFRGGWVPPAMLHRESPSSLVFGDPSDNYRFKMSEQKTAFKVQALAHDRYNKKQAAAQTLHVNLQPGDSCLQFHTTTARDFNIPRKLAAIDTKDKPHPVFSKRAKESYSREFITTHNRIYAPVDCQNYAPRESLTWKQTQSHVILGDMELKPYCFTTMHKTDFVPPKAYPEKVDYRLCKATNIKFTWDDDKGYLSMSRQAMLPHDLRNSRREEIQQRTSYSSVILPWQDQQFFSTEYKDLFPYKYLGPMVPIKGKIQMSRVPLGTFQSHRFNEKGRSPARAAQ